MPGSTLTTAQALIAFYEEITQVEFPDFIVAELMSQAAKALLSDGTLIVKAPANV